MKEQLLFEQQTNDNLEREFTQRQSAFVTSLIDQDEILFLEYLRINPKEYEGLFRYSSSQIEKWNLDSFGEKIRHERLGIVMEDKAVKESRTPEVKFAEEYKSIAEN